MLNYLLIVTCYGFGCYLAYRAGRNSAERLAADCLAEILRRLTLLTGKNETEIKTALLRAGNLPSKIRVAK